MAQDQDHRFEKVKVDKSTAEQAKHVSSSFAALSLHARTQQHHPYIVADELAVKSSEEDLSRRLREGEDLERLNGEDLDRESGRQNGEDLERETGRSETSSGYESMPSRVRGTSISFANEITTSDGDRRMLEEPLPRSAPRQIPLSLLHNGVEQKDDWQQENGEPMHNGNLLGKRNEQSLHVSTNGKSRDSSTSPLADTASTIGHDSFVTSTTTASPVALDSTTSTNGMLSPASATATPTEPILAPDNKPSPFWPNRRSESTRSRSYQRLEKAGLTGSSGRSRRSTRSANSSISPASAFLSQWGRASSQAQEEAPEPDDEGQEIGDSGWIIGRKIGYGGFSVVKEVFTLDSKTGKRVVRAVKIIRKHPAGVRDDQQNERIQTEFEHEIAIWRFLRHKYILPLLAVYDTPFATFCINKLNIGGTLHDLIRSRRQQYKEPDRGLSAPLAKRYTYQLAAAIRFLHVDVRVVHRDIKLENCLLDMSAPDAATQGGNILLCDFGMADFIQTDAREDNDHSKTAHNIGPAGTSSQLGNTATANTTTTTPADLNNRDTTLTIMGSLEYAAPEIITATETLFSTAADIWAFGVCVYALLTGSLPFSHAMREKLVVLIEKTMWDVGPLYGCPAVRGGGLAGTAAVDLVRGCLTSAEGERWDVGRVLGSRWLINCREVYGDGCLGEGEGVE